MREWVTVAEPVSTPVSSVIVSYLKLEQVFFSPKYSTNYILYLVYDKFTYSTWIKWVDERFKLVAWNVFILNLSSQWSHT